MALWYFRLRRWGKYTKAINELHNNQNSHKREINLQISLTKQLIDNYNNTITLLAKNQKHIKNHINIFKSNLNQSVMDVTTFLKVQITLLQIILNWQTFITFLDNLENAVTFAKLGTLHTSIISVGQFLNLSILYGEEKVLLSRNLESYYQLPAYKLILLKIK